MTRPNRNDYINSARMLLHVDGMRGVAVEHSLTQLLITAADTTAQHKGVEGAVGVLRFLADEIERGAK